MLQEVLSHIYEIVGLLLAGLGTYVAKFIVALVKSHLKGFYADLVIRTTEQIGNDLTGSEKYDLAAEKLVAMLRKVGIKRIDADELEELIESSVQKMNSSFQQTLKEEYGKNETTTTTTEAK